MKIEEFVAGKSMKCYEYSNIGRLVTGTKCRFTVLARPESGQINPKCGQINFVGPRCQTPGAVAEGCQPIGVFSRLLRA